MATFCCSRLGTTSTAAAVTGLLFKSPSLRPRGSFRGVHVVTTPPRTTTPLRCGFSPVLLPRGSAFLTTRRWVSEDRKPSPSQADKPRPLTARLETARERTKQVTSTLRSTLSLPATARENIYNLPNLLTVSRLIAAPLTAYLLVHDQYRWALALFAYAGITDLVDGWIARRWKLQTVAGSVMDPMADKALMIILTVTLAVKGALPLYLATLILGRDASLAIAAIYYRYASLPAPKTFTRYWDFSLPSAQVHPTTVSKYNTFLQLVLIGGTLVLNTSPNLLGESTETLMRGYQWLVAATTAWSGLSYAFLKDAVTILGEDEGVKAKQGARGRAIIGVGFGGVVVAAVWIALFVDEEVSKDDERVAEGE